MSSMSSFSVFLGFVIFAESTLGGVGTPASAESVPIGRDTGVCSFVSEGLGVLVPDAEAGLSSLFEGVFCNDGTTAREPEPRHQICSCCCCASHALWTS